MALVSVTNVVVKKNPAKLDDKLEFDVTLECSEALNEDIEWKMVYIMDPNDPTSDQELDCVLLGPIVRGAFRFTFQAKAPDYTKVDRDNFLNTTAVVIVGTYRNQDFINLGWFVATRVRDGVTLPHEIDSEYMSLEDLLPNLEREVISAAPRVTLFEIEWRPQEPESDVAASAENK